MWNSCKIPYIYDKIRILKKISIKISIISIQSVSAKIISIFQKNHISGNAGLAKRLSERRFFISIIDSQILESDAYFGWLPKCKQQPTLTFLDHA